MPRGIDPYHDVSENNKRTIQGFCDTLQLREDRAPATIYSYKCIMIEFARFLKVRTFQQVIDNPKIMDEWLRFIQNNGYKVGTRNTAKTGVRVFFTWLNGGKIPECLQNIKYVSRKKLKEKEDPNANKEKEATVEEYEQMLEASLKHEEEVQMPAMIEILNWFGCRPVELVSMNIGGTGKDEKGVFITIRKSKTHTRKIYVNDCNFQHFLKYLDEHPFREQLEKPVWISYYRREKHLQRLTQNDVYRRIRKVKKLAGITRAVSPKSFRHRCMNYRILELGMNPQQASFFFGTDITTIMDNYIHNRQENYNKWLKAQHKGDLKPSYNELEREK